MNYKYILCKSAPHVFLPQPFVQNLHKETDGKEENVLL